MFLAQSGFNLGELKLAHAIKATKTLPEKFISVLLTVLLVG